jgi:hypothetical protein
VRLHGRTRRRSLYGLRRERGQSALLVAQWRLPRSVSHVPGPAPVSVPEQPRCQCTVSCVYSRPCLAPVTQEDWLCDWCREAKLEYEKTGESDHCHDCAVPAGITAGRELTPEELNYFAGKWHELFRR